MLLAKRYSIISAKSSVEQGYKLLFIYSEPQKQELMVLYSDTYFEKLYEIAMSLQRLQDICVLQIFFIHGPLTVSV